MADYYEDKIMDQLEKMIEQTKRYKERLEYDGMLDDLEKMVMSDFIDTNLELFKTKEGTDEYNALAKKLDELAEELGDLQVDLFPYTMLDDDLCD